MFGIVFDSTLAYVCELKGGFSMSEFMSMRPGCVCGHHPRECGCEETAVDKHRRLYARAVEAAKKEDSGLRVKMNENEFELCVQAYYQAFAHEVKPNTRWEGFGW